MENWYGLLGVPILFGLAFIWCWLEERSRRIAKRKYDKQMAKYDKWFKSS